MLEKDLVGDVIVVRQIIATSRYCISKHVSCDVTRYDRRSRINVQIFSGEGAGVDITNDRHLQNQACHTRG